MFSIWKNNEIFMATVESIIEMKQKDVSFQYIWDELYNETKISMKKISDEKFKECVRDITIADFVDEVLKLKYSNEYNDNSKPTALKSKKIKNVDTVHLNKAKVMSSTNNIDNFKNVLISRDQKLISNSICDFNCEKECCINVTLSTK